ncbi:hypothetical protein HAX54_049499 [Datura stramonium]|uniref:Protein kinase domain-containing protein n=1 Tax=Datura stramonium TaxID=4076 RepID=A0ABS8RQS4_DATST|nr:hypothetical protein [Datura stramonium]
MHHFRGLISKPSSSASREKLKKKEHYLKNGSALLEEFIALCDRNCRIALRYFGATEIERATKESAENRVIFIGGMYMVKGLLDKRRVLVRFRDSTFHRNSSDICRDVAITSQMGHLKNVLKLIGCFLEYAEPVMVYEYVKEATTHHNLLFNNDDHARNTDLNSQKVFIDLSSGVAKLFDFSFSISLPPGELEVEAQDAVCGTCEHIDPEYCCSAIVTQKTDVYGFGNVLFQLLAGKEKPGIDHEIRQQLENYLDLVKRCTASKGEDRPYMIYVAKELRRIEKCFRALNSLT